MSQTPPSSGGPPSNPDWSAGQSGDPQGGQPTTSPPTGQSWDPGPAPGMPPPPSYGQPAPFYAQPGATTSTNGLAIASLVCGIANFVIIGGIGAILAVIFGHIAKRQIRNTGQGGSGLATAGLILGYIGVAFAAIGIVIAIVLIAAAASSNSGG